MTVNDRRRDVLDGAFAHPAFVASRRRGAAALLLAGAPLRIVWANAAAAAVFEAHDHTALAARLLRSDPGSARRLDQLAAALVPGAPPRLERLRFMWSFSPHSVTLLCARPDGFDGMPALALAAASPGFEAAQWHDGAPGSPSWPDAPPSTTASPMGHVGETAAESSSDAGALEHAREAMRAAAGGADLARFVWRTDAQGRVGEIDQGLLDRLGLGWRPQGLDLAESAAGFDPAGAESLARAIAAQATWRGFDIEVPLGDAAATSGLRVPISLSASPVLEPGGRFAGYRGFGRIDLQRLHEGPEIRIDPPEPAAIEDAAYEPAEHAPADHAPVPTRADEAVPPVAEPVVASVPVDPERLAPDPRPDEPLAPTAAAPISPPRAEEPPRPANVVQLRPPVPGGRTPGGRQDGNHADAGTGEPSRGLSDSERVNFQEIGRTLTAAVGAIPPVDGAASAKAGSPASSHGPAPHPGSTDQAARLVDAMATGLLVVRHPRVLFANEALLADLRYDSHAALADALGLGFAGRAAPTLDAFTMRLPGAYGDSLNFAAAGRPVDWDGEPAVLWTLRPADTASAQPAAPGRGEDADLQAMLDALDGAVACIDETGRVLARNREAARWFGPGVPADLSITALLAPESRAALLTRLGELEGAPDSRSRADHLARAANGGMVPVGLTLTRLGPGRFVAAWRDLSAEREIEWEMARLKSQTERVNGQQPELLAKISHEIRTPLNAILGFAEVMIDERFGPLGNVRYKDYLQDIHASGTHVMKLVSDLLDLSRIETGRLDLDLGAFDLNKVITECVALIQVEAHRQRVIVRTSLAPRLPPVVADEPSARQIVANVLSNAVRFNEPGGQVIVSSAADESGGVVVRLRDTGIGMTDAEIATALEPFRQLAPSKSLGGTGLGLPLAKALAVANGASLSIRSRPGEGTMVEITFQSSAVPAARVPA